MWNEVRIFLLSGILAIGSAYSGNAIAQDRCSRLLTFQERLGCYENESVAVKEEIKSLEISIEELKKNTKPYACILSVPDAEECAELDENKDLENSVCEYERKLICKNLEESILSERIALLEHTSLRLLANNPYRSRLCRSVRDSRLKLRCLRKLYRSTEIEAQNLGDWIMETDGRDGTFNCPAVVRFNSCTDVDSVYPERLNDICLGYDKLPCYSLKKVEIMRQIVAARGRFVRQSRR